MGRKDGGGSFQWAVVSCYTFGSPAVAACGSVGDRPQLDAGHDHVHFGSIGERGGVSPLMGRRRRRVEETKARADCSQYSISPQVRKIASRNFSGIRRIPPRESVTWWSRRASLPSGVKVRGRSDVGWQWAVGSRYTFGRPTVRRAWLGPPIFAAVPEIGHNEQEPGNERRMPSLALRVSVGRAEEARPTGHALRKDSGRATRRHASTHAGFG